MSEHDTTCQSGCHHTFTKEVNGYSIYVQPGGCIEITDRADPGDPMVHICVEDWEDVKDAITVLIDRRNHE